MNRVFKALADPTRRRVLQLRLCFAWAGLMLASRIGLRLAITRGLLGASWLEPGRRFSGRVLATGMIASATTCRRSGRRGRCSASRSRGSRSTVLSDKSSSCPIWP
jgi:hypothetical protein